MITDHGLAALRLAATLNHLYPMLSTTLWADGRPVVRIEAPQPETEHAASPTAGRTGVEGVGVAPALHPTSATTVELTPCGFRAATARAWAQHRAGRRLRLVDLDTDPEVEVTVADGDQVWPSAIVRVRRRDVVVYAFATLLAPDRCRAHASDLLDATPAPDGVLDLLLQRDTDTEVTIVSAEVDPEHREACETEVLDLFEALLARFAVLELLDDLAPERARPERRQS
jgi:hypothetical protein